MSASTNKTILIVLFLMTVVPLQLFSEIPPKPNPPRLVNDLAGLLSQEEVARLEQKLVDYNDSTSTQITVVTISSLDGYDIDDLAQRIGQNWEIGRAHV